MLDGVEYLASILKTDKGWPTIAKLFWSNGWK